MIEFWEQEQLAMMKKKKKKKSPRAKASKESNDPDKFKSPIPPHLTPEEREAWEKDFEWEKKERQRRKKEGLYPDAKGKRITVRSGKRSEEDRPLNDVYY
jgi:hypothetical protein